MPHVLTTGGWEEMRWHRWVGADRAGGGWAMQVIDTSELTESEVAAAVLSWCRRALRGQAPMLRLAGD